MVDYKRSRYTHHSYLKAQLAHKIHRIIRSPSTKNYKPYTEKIYMIDFPISLTDVNASGHIFGKYEGSLYGKTVRSNPNQVCSTHINTPKNLMERHQPVILSADFIFVNGIPFFFTISHHIKFITALMTKYQRIKPVIETVKEIKSHYASASSSSRRCRRTDNLNRSAENWP